MHTNDVEKSEVKKENCKRRGDGYGFNQLGKEPAVCSLEHSQETCCSVKLNGYLDQQRDWEF